MAITEQKRGDKTYLSYVYWNGSKLICIDCGRKDDPKTAEKIKEAKRKHTEAKIKNYEDKIREMQEGSE